MIATTTLSTFIGADVGKECVDVVDHKGGAIKRLPNEASVLLYWAHTLDPSCLVVCEATGGYEAALLAALTEAGIPVHRADARKVKSFIRSFGVLGKTDALDARALAKYGEERHAQLPLWQAPDEARKKLQSMVLARRDLVTQRTAFNNRLQAPEVEAVQPYLKAVLDCLDTQIAALDADIDKLIRDDKALRKAGDILREIPGIGAKTAAALLGLMPELGTCDRRKAAALAGLAPHPCQSGSRDAYRRVKGGRPEVKRTLFMAALSAAKHNDDMKAFYKRLIANGKRPIVALTAIMRKLIVIANARIRDGMKKIPMPN